MIFKVKEIRCYTVIIEEIFYNKYPNVVVVVFLFSYRILYPYPYLSNLSPPIDSTLKAILILYNDLVPIDNSKSANIYTYNKEYFGNTVSMTVNARRTRRMTIKMIIIMLLQ